MAIDPKAHEWIEEFTKIYPAKTQNMRKYLPKISAPRDTLQTLAVKYDTTSIDITSSGTPVEIGVTYTEDTVSVVDFSAKTPSILNRNFSNRDVVESQTELILRQFLENENKLILNTLSTAPVSEVTVDTTTDTTEPDVYQVADALDIAIDNVNIYSQAPKLLVIANDSKKYLFKKTPEMMRPIDILKDNEVAIMESPDISNTAYLMPLDSSVHKLVQVEPLDIRIENENFDLASIFGRESIAYLVNQPEVIQKLDFTTK